MLELCACVVLRYAAGTIFSTSVRLKRSSACSRSMVLRLANRSSLRRTASCITSCGLMSANSELQTLAIRLLRLERRQRTQVVAPTVNGVVGLAVLHLVQEGLLVAGQLLLEFVALDLALEVGHGHQHQPVGREQAVDKTNG